MLLLRAWLAAFFVTVASELVVAVLLLVPGGSRARRVAAVCLAQLPTHPSVWFIWPLLNLPRPVAGAADSALYRDVKMVKDAGMNFIRGSHYPKAPAFADAATT